MFTGITTGVARGVESHPEDAVLAHLLTRKLWASSAGRMVQPVIDLPRELTSCVAGAVDVVLGARVSLRTACMVCIRVGS